MKLAGLVWVMLLVFAVGCGPTYKEGTQIDAAKRSELVKGGTTADEVVQLFGKPAKIEKLPTGGEKYLYTYQSEEYVSWRKLSKLDKQTLEVFIKDGVVQNYIFVREFRGDIIPQKESGK